ncbi:MAG: DUF3224 domain-containing protein [Oceanicaulis sp.]|uniref:DUF3224 domain-containing protein n=1 Tax=Glycocaulis sp. TaxID=1969725 RepID=UPI0025C66157|nr:DUF3224 domain-containing protein [Glycocaulis sp.]MCC5981067.1 DUF3224 domain-containing protein [Oceanicaulis sp.]MCH8522660.1 DUF3224 domain-containing protein [Glycocaulis sp.]
MIRQLTGVTAALCLLAPAALAEDAAMTSHTATGTFTVQLTPQGEPGPGAHTRYVITKAFHGDFEGTAAGEMLGLFDAQAGSGAYVLIERLEGRLEGREGAFSLVHRGVMDAGAQSLSITIVPGSGTGDLSGIAGEFLLDIVEGVHNYTLEYTLPSGEGQ